MLRIVFRVWLLARRSWRENGVDYGLSLLWVVATERAGGPYTEPRDCTHLLLLYRFAAMCRGAVAKGRLLYVPMREFAYRSHLYCVIYIPVYILSIWRLTATLVVVPHLKPTDAAFFIYSTNIRTEYLKHTAYSPFFPLQNVVYFIMLPFLVLYYSNFIHRVC